MHNRPTAASPAKLQYQIEGYLLGGEIMSRFGEDPWLTKTGLSPLMLVLEDGTMESFTLDPDGVHFQEHEISLTLTPNPKHPNWMLTASITCFARPGIVGRVAGGWEEVQAGLSKARGILFPSPDGGTETRLWQEPAGGDTRYGKCSIVVTDLDECAGNWPEYRKFALDHGKIRPVQGTLPLLPPREHNH